ncbi:MAG: hypothetical protein B5M48_00410 [Candidatus Omnitrophica bacterium 4484_213]|nr:MAG: hypothetical protein B5M48_00410 [Candidatus Omnitrophica bacterium 4484_213]
MSKRIISSLILIAITCLFLFALPSHFFVFWVISFVAVGLGEFAELIHRKGIFVHKYIGMLAAIAFCLPFLFGQELLILFISLLSLFLLQFTHKKRDVAIFTIATTLLGIVYIGWLGSFWTRLIFLSHSKSWILFLLLVCKGGDAGAYLIGKKFGRHKLIPRISPFKSREGAIGGFIFSIVIALISGYLFLNVSYFHILVLGALSGIFAQIGDLAESLLKRDADVKDSGKIFPGLGGSLDLIDSLLFSAPVVYFYLVKIVSV